MLDNRTIEIWTHRYRKYLNITLSFYNWAKIYVLVKINKLFNRKTKYIGILLAEHFGDIVACEPIIRELKRQYPNSKVYWIVKKTYRELLDHNPNVDIILEEYSVLSSMLLARKSPFDEFHNCHLSGLRRYNYLRKTLKNPRAEVLNILTHNYFDFGNILEIFAKVGGLPFSYKSPHVYIPEAVEKRIDQLKFYKKTIVIHCHSNYSPKDWQIYHWQKLVLDFVKNFDFEIVEIGLKSNLNIYHSGYYNFCGKLSLLETAELIKRAEYFIGIDSGPAHLANAVGTYGFLLFGKLGDFEEYMPYSGGYQTKSNATYIIKKGLPCSELEYEEVWNVISEIIQEKDLVTEIKNS